MVTRVTGTTEMVYLSHKTLAEGGTGALSAITSEENLLREKVSKKGRSALICLSVAQLDTFGSVENFIRN